MDVEKPWTTELSVRMDCNGCAHRMRKALSGVKDVHDVQIDMPQQKITVVGRADPDKMVKAIKKTRKIATISSHVDPSAPPPEAPPPPAEEPPAAPVETPPAPEEAPPAPTEENPPPAPTAEENPPPAPTTEENPPPPPSEETRGEIPMVHPYPHHWDINMYDQFPYNNNYYATAMHSYNNSEPPSSARILAEAPQNFHLSNEYYQHHQQHDQQLQHQQLNYGGGGSDGNINSMFSDENPNACTSF